MPKTRPTVDFPTVLRRRMLCVMLVAAAACSFQSGCINIFAIAGKMLMGDPKAKSTFEQRTGVSLVEEKKRCIIACTAPASVMSEFDGLTLDLQEEILRRMTLRGMDVIDCDAVASELNDSGGRFDPVKLAKAFPDVDYVFHIDLERFTLLDEGSINLFRGRALGSIIGYEARGSGDEVPRHVSTVFEQEFSDEYPASHPVAADQTKPKVFLRQFVSHVADVAGRTFYDVRTSETY